MAKRKKNESDKIKLRKAQELEKARKSTPKKSNPNWREGAKWVAASPIRPKTTQDTIIGSTNRIKKGRYKNLMGVVLEKQTIKQLQLDTIEAPLRFEQVRVLHYAKDVDLSDPHQKYMNAKVLVRAPHENEGKEGTVVKLIVLGDWYITDNPKITTAFPKHKFDVVREAPCSAATAIAVDDGDKMDNCVEDGKKGCNVVDLSGVDTNAKGRGGSGQNKADEDVIMNEANDKGGHDKMKQAKDKQSPAPELSTIVNDLNKNEAEYAVASKDVLNNDVSKDSEKHDGYLAKQQQPPGQTSIVNDQKNNVAEEDGIEEIIRRSQQLLHSMALLARSSNIILNPLLLLMTRTRMFQKSMAFPKKRQMKRIHQQKM